MIGTMISESAQLCLGYAEKLFRDIPAGDFGRFANLGDELIMSNHPAFICGHLSLYPSRVVKELGGDASAIEASEKYQALFSPKAKCLDDPEHTLYPPKEELISKFFSAHQAAVDVLKSSDDAAFVVENPNEAMRGRFSTLGSMHAFYLGGHLMIHMGQLSAWRRAMKLPPV